jgi:hypothetical protein
MDVHPLEHQHERLRSMLRHTSSFNSAPREQFNYVKPRPDMLDRVKSEGVGLQANFIIGTPYLKDKPLPMVPKRTSWN